MAMAGRGLRRVCMATAVDPFIVTPVAVA
jgi:hypothetical protein